MKKIFLMILALLLCFASVFSLASCDKEETQKPAGDIFYTTFNGIKIELGAAAESTIATGVRSPMDMTSPRCVVKPKFVTAASATGTCHGPTIWSRWIKPPTERSPIVIKKLLEATVG